MADPDVVLVGTWLGDGEALRAHPLLSQAARRARGTHRGAAHRAAGHAQPLRRRRVLGPRPRAAPRPRARRARREPSAAPRGRVRSCCWPRCPLALLLGALPWAASRFPSGGVAGLAGRRGRAWRGGSPLDAGRRDDPVVGAPAARAAGRAGRRRPGRGGRRAAVRLPQPDGGLGPARRGLGRGARRGAGRAAWAGRRTSSWPCRSPRSRARWPRCSPSTCWPTPAAVPTLHGLLLTGLAVSALAGAGTSVLLVATEEFRVKTVLFWLAGGLEGRGWTHVRLARRVHPRRRRAAAGAAVAPARRALAGRATRRPRSACPSTPRASASWGWPRWWPAPARPWRARCPSWAWWPRTRCARCVGPLGRHLLPAAFLGGAVLVVLADLLSRTLSDAHRPAAGLAHRVRGRAVLPARAARAARTRDVSAASSRRAALVGARAARAAVLHGVDARRCAPGEALALVGPERGGQVDAGAGAGRPAARRPAARCACEGRPLPRWDARRAARARSPSSRPRRTRRRCSRWRTAWRWDAIPHRGPFRPLDGRGPRAPSRARWTRTGIARAARRRRLGTLSAGERQLATLARGLAQEPRVLLLDEPAAHLDVGHQLRLFRVLDEVRARGVAVLAVVHDLQRAAAWAERMVLLAGRPRRRRGRARRGAGQRGLRARVRRRHPRPRRAGPAASALQRSRSRR